jgi:hypothetical protein
VKDELTALFMLLSLSWKRGLGVDDMKDIRERGESAFLNAGSRGAKVSAFSHCLLFRLMSLVYLKPLTQAKG